jgi:hypothetical protein
MKKILLAIAVICSITALAACGGTGGEKPSASPSVAESVQPSAPESIAPSSAPSVEETVAPSVAESVEPSAEPTVEPTVEPTQEDLFAQITFSNRTIRYNGTAQRLEVKNLPENATVTYAENENSSAENLMAYTEDGAICPGVYGITATVTIGEESREYKAVLTLNKAKLTISANKAEKDLYDPNPAFTFTVTGLLEGHELDLTAGTWTEGVFAGEFVVSCSAEQYSDIGSYDIVAEELTSPYYDITYRKAALSIKKYTTDLVPGGVKPTAGGQMLYNGAYVDVMGVNYFDMFYECIDDNGNVVEANVQRTYAGLAELASYNVKCIRFFPMRYYKWQQKGWFENREVFIYTWHRIINKAASYNIGLIPSVLFNNEIMNNVEGGYDWRTVTEQLQNGIIPPSVQLAFDYTEIFVEEFEDHPAIWMWEFSNETNLVMDVNNYGYYYDSSVAYREAWAELVYNLDDYKRAIGSGDSVLRNYQYNMAMIKSWTTDTKEEHEYMLKLLNGGKLSAISSHCYISSEYERVKEEYKKDPFAIEDDLKASYMGDKVLYNQALAAVPQSSEEDWYTTEYFGTDTIKELMCLLVEEAAKFGKTCYIGETGFSYADHRLYTEEELDLFLVNFAKAKRESKMPITLFWNYDYKAQPIAGQYNDRGTGIEFSWNASWTKGRKYLECIKAYNDATEAKA